jgi:hypothetical protein
MYNIKGLNICVKRFLMIPYNNINSRVSGYFQVTHASNLRIVTRKERNNLLVFIATTYSLSILLSLFIGFTGGHESKFILLQFASMLIPAVAVLIMNNFFKAPLEEIKWNKLPVYWLPLALLLMPLTIHIICLPLINFLNSASKK